MGDERSGTEVERLGVREREGYNSSQADDNLALTFLRHLQSRFNLNHNNQFANRSKNIKHV